MGVGYSTDRGQVDATLGGLVVTLRDRLRQAEHIGNWLYQKTDEDLLEMGYNEDDVVILRDAVGALAALKRVAFGEAEQNGPNNFFFSAAKLTGLE